MTKEQIREKLLEVIQDKTTVDISSISDDELLANYGIDSVQVVQIIDQLERDLDMSLPTNFFWEYDTLNKAMTYLMEEMNE